MVLNLTNVPETLPRVQATLKAVKRVIAAEVNEVFLKTIYGEDTDVKTEKDLRNKLKTEIEQYFEKQSDQKLYNVLAGKLIDETRIELPDSFLKRWIKLTNEKPITKEKIEEEYPAFARNLKWSLIIKK
ncbi:MAG: hypothetical protein LRY27_01865 [Chitinophagales bacterium]|nr:hypothetical protein [Chitinophagales bacterium]